MKFYHYFFAALLVMGLTAVIPAFAADDDDDAPAAKTKVKPLKPAVNIGSIVNKSTANLNITTFVDRLGTALNNTRQFRMIESDRIADIVSEWNKAASGLTAEQMTENPSMASPGYKIIATITAFEIKTAQSQMGGAAFRKTTARLGLNVRMMRLSDGVVVVDKEIVGESVQKDSATANSSNSASGDMFYQNCVKDASQKVVNEMMELCYPIKVLSYEDDEVIIRIQKERAEQAINDPATAGHFKVFRVTGSGENKVEKELATIKITSVDTPTQATCEIVSFKGNKPKKITKKCICHPTRKPKMSAPKTGFDDL